MGPRYFLTPSIKEYRVVGRSEADANESSQPYSHGYIVSGPRQIMQASLVYVGMIPASEDDADDVDVGKDNTDHVSKGYWTPSSQINASYESVPEGQVCIFKSQDCH